VAAISSRIRPGVGFSPDDFSMGVIGQSEPEPATWALLGGGLSALPIAARSRRGPKRRTYYSVGLVQGAHAPSRACDDALVIGGFSFPSNRYRQGVPSSFRRGAESPRRTGNCTRGRVRFPEHQIATGAHSSDPSGAEENWFDKDRDLSLPCSLRRSCLGRWRVARRAERFRLHR